VRAAPRGVERDERGDADQRLVLGRARRVLDVAAARTRRRRRHAHRRDDLAGLQRRLVESSEEARNRYGAAAAGTNHPHLGVVTHEGRRRIGSGFGVGEVAADRARRPDRRRGDAPRRLGHERPALAHHPRALDVRVGGQRAELEGATVEPDPGQRRNAV
jgi:hypothetical protein